MPVIGTTARITGTYTAASVNTAPTTAVVRVEDPDGVVTLPSVSSGATGIKYVEVALTKVGRWFVRFEGTGTVPAAAETYIDVDPSAFYD